MPWKSDGSYVDDRRAAYPGKGLAMDHGNSATTAIKEFCRGCMCQRNVADCPSTRYPLFVYRPGANDTGAVQRKPGDVPTVEEYEAMLKARDPEGVKAAAARERFKKAKEGEGDDDDTDE